MLASLTSSHVHLPFLCVAFQQKQNSSDFWLPTNSAIRKGFIPHAVKRHLLYLSFPTMITTESKTRLHELHVVGTLVAQRDDGTHVEAAGDMEHATQLLLVVAVHDQAGNALGVCKNANVLDEECSLLVGPRLHRDAGRGGPKETENAVGQVQNPAE